MLDARPKPENVKNAERRACINGRPNKFLPFVELSVFRPNFVEPRSSSSVQKFDDLSRNTGRERNKTLPVPLRPPSLYKISADENFFSRFFSAARVSIPDCSTGEIYRVLNFRSTARYVRAIVLHQRDNAIGRTYVKMGTTIRTNLVVLVL